MKRQTLLSTLFLIGIVNTLALSVCQAQGGIRSVNGALGDVNTGVRTLFPTVENIAAVVMAIIGVIAAIKVYSKWSGGDPDVRETAMQWFGALIFASIVLVVIESVFSPR